MSGRFLFIQFALSFSHPAAFYLFNSHFHFRIRPPSIFFHFGRLAFCCFSAENSQFFRCFWYIFLAFLEDMTILSNFGQNLPNIFTIQEKSWIEIGFFEIIFAKSQFKIICTENTLKVMFLVHSCHRFWRGGGFYPTFGENPRFLPANHGQKKKKVGALCILNFLCAGTVQLWKPLKKFGYLLSAAPPKAPTFPFS